MYSPTTRVLTVLELLQTHGRLSGTELARRIEVDGRTLRRYISKLEDLGIPVTTERGRYGSYSLMAGFKLPPMMFTDDEALALSLGLLAARGLGLAEAAPAVQSAQAKLERVTPRNLKNRIRALAETVTLDLGRPAEAGDNATLLALSAAAHGWQRVYLRYRSAEGEETAREFDPYGLAYKGGRWYVLGQCHLRGGLRSFRLDRVQQVEARNAVFTPPADFNAVQQLAHGLATMPREHTVKVWLHTGLEAAQRAFPESFGVFQPGENGVMLHSQTDHVGWYAGQLARLPFAFEVLEPPLLRDALRARALQILENHPAQAGATPA